MIFTLVFYSHLFVTSALAIVVSLVHALYTLVSIHLRRPHPRTLGQHRSALLLTLYAASMGSLRTAKEYVLTLTPARMLVVKRESKTLFFWP